MSVYAYWKLDGSLSVNGLEESELESMHIHWLELCASLVGTEECLRVDGRTGDVCFANHVFHNIFNDFQTFVARQEDGFIAHVVAMVNETKCERCKGYGHSVVSEFLEGRPNKRLTTCNCDEWVDVWAPKKNRRIAPPTIYRHNPLYDETFPLMTKDVITPTYPRIVAFTKGGKMHVLGIHPRQLTSGQRECLPVLALIVGGYGFLKRSTHTGTIVHVNHLVQEFLHDVWDIGSSLNMDKLAELVDKYRKKSPCCSRIFNDAYLAIQSGGKGRIGHRMCRRQMRKVYTLGVIGDLVPSDTSIVPGMDVELSDEVDSTEEEEHVEWTSHLTKEQVKQFMLPFLSSRSMQVLFGED